MKIVPLPKKIYDEAKKCGIERLRVRIEPHYQEKAPSANIDIFPQSAMTNGDNVFFDFQTWAADVYVGKFYEATWDDFFPEGTKFFKDFEEDENGERAYFAWGLDVPVGVSIFYDLKNDTVRVHRWACVRHDVEDQIVPMEIK